MSASGFWLRPKHTPNPDLQQRRQAQTTHPYQRKEGQWSWNSLGELQGRLPSNTILWGQPQPQPRLLLLREALSRADRHRGDGLVKVPHTLTLALPGDMPYGLCICNRIYLSIYLYAYVQI